MMFGTRASALAGALLLAWSAGAAAQTTYVRGNDGDPETLDQHKTSTVVEARILRDLYEGLVIDDASAKVTPGVAESWTVSDDGTVYTFTLREDAQWSNGEPVTADDFVYSLRRIMTPATGAKYANILYPILNAEAVNTGETAPEELGVKAVDDKTLEITLASPTPYLLELLTHQTALPVYPPAVEEFGADFVSPEHIVTNGPFRLVSFAPNDRLVAEKSETFHDADSVKIDRVVFLPIEDRATCVRRFEAGEVHSCHDLPSEQIASLRERLGDQLHIAPYLGTYYYALNPTRGALGDVNVRQALSMAIDRDFLAEEIFSGTMLPAYALVPPGISNYVEDGPQLPYANTSMLDREDEAIAMMTEAGYGPDNPITLELAYNNSENHRNAATAIADMWAPLGVNVTFNARDLPAHYAMLRDEKNFDVARAGWIGDYSDPQNFLFLNISDNDGFNYGQYDNPEYDALMDEAASEGDLDKRATLLAEAEALFLRDLPQVPLLFYSSTSLVSPKVEGWVDNVRHVHPTRFLSLSE
ncbi:peptide ABC transporter substrate-binding protein [Acuticoccus kalidii]|uniref:peptide ABC transporter substrate-binding protein n=1 Tax=Acuticoccus kalidii TaxID=2910977 RepID=UPI003F723C95